MRRTCLILVVAVMLLAAVTPARGGLFYSLRFDREVYQVTPGSTLTVDLILSELATDGDQNRIGFYDPTADETYGVLGAEMKVSWDGTDAFVASKSDAAAGPDFTFLPSAITLNPQDIILKALDTNSLEGGDGVVGSQMTGPPGLHEVLLGHLTFTIADTFSTDSLITLDQQTVAADNDFLIKIGPEFQDFLAIDDVLQSGRAVLTAVPEPSSLVLLGLALAGLCWGERRRRA